MFEVRQVNEIHDRIADGVLLDGYRFCVNFFCTNFTGIVPAGKVGVDELQCLDSEPHDEFPAGRMWKGGFSALKSRLTKKGRRQGGSFGSQCFFSSVGFSDPERFFLSKVLFMGRFQLAIKFAGRNLTKI